MKVSTTVSSTFAATHDRHRVGLLVSITGESPVTRPPVNVALVLDRSGSMAGEPLLRAREAALRFASFLTAQDRLTVVAFDEGVQLLYGPGPGNDPRARQAIQEIRSGGTTNLSGGWLEGHRHLSRGLVEGTNRVLLLTDGQPNCGIVEVAALQGLARGAAEHHVSTTCIGFGPAFNEELLRGMSDSGRGRFWYVESADQMTGAFEGEIEGLVSLAAQNVAVEVSVLHPGVAGVSLVPSRPFERTPDGGWLIPLGDLYAAEPRSLGLIFHVENAGELLQVPVAEVRVRADLLRQGGVEHQTVTLPVMATLDGQDHVVPIVETTFLQFAVAEARDEAVRQADQGDLETASQILREAAEGLAPHHGNRELRELRDDLVAEADRLSERIYRSEDRKYHMARAAMVRDGRGPQQSKLSRRPRP